MLVQNGPIDPIFGQGVLQPSLLLRAKWIFDISILFVPSEPDPLTIRGWISAEKSWFLTSKPNLGTTHSLNCPKDAKNGFFGKFYIDIVNRKFSQLFFFDRKKIFFEKWKIFFRKTIIEFFLVRIWKFPLVKFSIMVFQKNIFHFSKLFFFRSEKKVGKNFESLYRCKIF